MTVRVHKLTLTSFRGATKQVEIEFDETKPVVLVFGENGTGKSTIGDAFDFVCNRKFGSLADHTMSEQPKSHVVSLGQDPKNLQVNLTTTAGDFVAKLSKSGPVITPTTGCPEARILRRSKILELLDAQPKQRFDSLKEFITVSGIEKSEAALRVAHLDAQNDCDAALKSSEQANDALQKLWIAEGSPGGEPLAWATTEATKDLTVLQSRVDEIGRLARAFETVELRVTALDATTLDIGKLRTALLRAQTEQKAAEAKEAAGDTTLLRLLEEARAYIAPRDPLMNCPVCEEGMKSEDVLARLNARIAAMSDLATASAAVTAAKRAVLAKQAVMAQGLNDFCASAGKLGAALKSSGMTEIGELKINWPVYEGLLAQDPTTEELATKARELVGLALPCRNALRDRQAVDQKSIAQKNAIKGHYDTHNEKRASATVLADLANKLERALDVVMTRRKAYVEGILAAISDEVERLYTALHPGEGIGKIRFYLKPNAIGSLEFDGQFQASNEIPPQAYYSESHLDTLGICVFLALTKHFKNDSTIVILDDVVTSVDGPHLDRFMNLLHDEAPNFNQIIVTTHYRPWKDRYRYARGPVARTQVIELRSWNVATGIQTDEGVSLVEELKTALAAGKFDRQSVASKAGIQLENVLDFLTFQYRCKLPRQADPNYTLGDLAAGIDSKLGKYLRITQVPVGGAKIDVMLKPLIDEATAQTAVRNRAGCHFHSLGSEMSDAEIRAFASNVVTITETIICAKCQFFPTRKPNGSNWQCECGAVEMHPLIAPGAALGTVATEQ